MGEKAIVLLSGGQDSTTCLGWAVNKFDEVVALSIFYGQKHASELDAAQRIADHFGVKRYVAELPVLKDLGDSDLVGGGEIKAAGGYGDSQAEGGLPTSFVPGRNLLFLSIAAAYAVKEGAKHIVTGVCQTDYSGYPDCREEFIKALEPVLDRAMPSECGPFEIHTPLMHLSKAATVLLAFDDERTWEALKYSVTCYYAEPGGGCGKCPACELRAKGFAEARLEDPAKAA